LTSQSRGQPRLSLCGGPFFLAFSQVSGNSGCSLTADEASKGKSVDKEIEDILRTSDIMGKRVSFKFRVHQKTKRR